MTSSSTAHKTIKEDSEVPIESDDGTMAELRSLLLGPTETQLAEVHERLTDPERQLAEVSRVLPDAIAVRSRQDDNLTAALSPTVSAALERSIRKDPQPVADAIFPIIGPAIRKAISAALSGMAQSFNQALTYSMSLQGLKWRFEALRTGRPFSEVVLLHTLIYRVEQVFLIHRGTGLLLRHVSATGVLVQDADMVSGMLTAIQDFVHDSFTAKKEDGLETLQVGELTVWIEQAPHAILAGVIRGIAPPDLRAVFQETLEHIHLQFATDMREFDGDAARFGLTEEMLEDCLKCGYDLERRAKTNRKITPLRVIAALLLVGILVWGFFWIRDRRRWNAYLDSLRSEPGIVVTDSGKEGGKYFVSGLRDPLSRNPGSLIQNSGLDSNSVIGRWQEFQALTPDFVISRARKLLNPPTTVKLSFLDGTLEAEGFARNEWVEETRRTARFLPGITQFKDDKVLDLNRIENPLLMFDTDKTELRQDQEEKINGLLADLNKLRTLSGGRNVTLEITGRADRVGSQTRNQELSQGRADTVAALLKTRLADWSNLTIRTVGSKDQLKEELSEEDRATNRSVNLKVTVQ